MDSPHILHLIDSLNIGGTEGKLFDLIAGLLKRGYRVSVGYCTPGPWAEKLEALGIRVTQLPHFGRVDPSLVFRMVRLIRNDPPQIVHTHLFKSDFHGRLAAHLAGVPVVIGGLHNSDPWARNRLLGLIYGATARFTDCLLAVSEEVKQYHVERTGVSPEKILTIENGVDVERFTGQDSAGQKVRAEFGIAPDAIVFGIIGRLKPQKDHATFLESAREIFIQYPTARFLVVGDGPLYSELETMARELSLFPSLIFTGVRTDIPAVLSALDVLVLSSRWEGLPNVVLEAMAVARPVVATSVDGVEGVVTSGKTGLLVPPGDSLALAQACIELINDPDLRHRLGRAGYRHVAENYSFDTMVDRYEACYIEQLRLHGFQRPEGSNSLIEVDVS